MLDSAKTVALLTVLPSDATANDLKAALVSDGDEGQRNMNTLRRIKYGGARRDLYGAWIACPDSSLIMNC